VSRGISGDGDQRQTKPIRNNRQEAQNLFRLATVGDGHHHVTTRDHADIAMGAISRMQEKGWDAKTGERCCQLSPDQPGLSHAGHHNTSLTLVDQVDTLQEGRVKALMQLGNGAALQLQHASRLCQDFGGGSGRVLSLRYLGHLFPFP